MELSPDHTFNRDKATDTVKKYIAREILPDVVSTYDNEDDPIEGKNG